MGFPLLTKEIADAVAAMSDRWENAPLFQEMTWSKRTRRAMEMLARYGLDLDKWDLDFADICQFSEGDLLKMRGFGKTSLEELKAKLSESGWKLAERSHTVEELNRRFREGYPPESWTWGISPETYRLVRAKQKARYEEWKERVAFQATLPTFSIPTDPEARNEWLRTGNGLIEHPPAGKI